MLLAAASTMLSFVVGCFLGTLPQSPDQVSRGQWPLGLEIDFPAPDLPPLSQIPTVEALGKRLFFDTILSLDETRSCASCHLPTHSFASNERFSTGVSGVPGTRNAPMTVNRVFGRSHFWDGRAATLSEQARGPLLSDVEMGMTEELIYARLSADPLYVAEFKRTFGEQPTLDKAAWAIAVFELTLVSGGSPFDRYEWGGDRLALSPAAERGLLLFRGKAGCSTCHVGTNFSDEKFHNIGIGGNGDLGRMRITGIASDLGRFKTPSLRNVAETSPYMHDGSLVSLMDVIEHYNAGGKEVANLDPEIRPLELMPTDKADLVAFLQSLSGSVVSVPAVHILELYRTQEL